MKQTLWSMISLLMTLLALPSCMSDNDTATAPESAILSFSVNSITSSVIAKKYDSHGNATDTVVSRTIAGSDIYFNIDQVNGHIYSVDSLPNWVNVKRVVPTFTCYGNVYGKVVVGDNTYYALTSGSDSIDFSKTVDIVCVSTDGTSTKYYKVDLYKHVANTDTLEWEATASDLAIAGQSKMFCVDGRVFAFSTNGDGDFVTTFADSQTPTTWSVPMVVPVDFNSVVLFDGNFYGLDAEGYIYRSSPNQLAATWSRASNQQVERLLAADGYRIYAYDGHAIIGSEDLTTWTVQGSEDLDMLPEASIHSSAYTSATNDNLQVAVLTGIASNNSQHATAWYKLSSTDDSTDQPWAYIQVTADNPYGLPRLDNLSVAHYNGALFAIGAQKGKYRYLYRSDDNGITWHPQTEKYPVPDDLDAANGAASIVAVGQTLWIIQENGTVWQGSIQ